MNKIERVKNDNYTKISNNFIRDKNLSLKAKGFLAIVMSLPSDWDFSINGICAVIKEGKTSIYSVIKELRINKYCSYSIFKNKGRIIKYNYIFYDTPYFINYKDQLKDKRWKKLANKIRKRDNYTCQKCGSHEHLQVHHKKYIKNRLAWEYDDSNLITLCSDCHKKIHNIK